MAEPPLHLLAREFDDFDELCHALRGWDIELSQLDTGRFEGQLVQASTGRTLLSYARFGRLLEQRGAPPPGVWTFGIPAPDCPELIWRGARASPGDIIVQPPDMELDALSQDGFSIFTFSVAEEHLARVADALDLPAERLLSRVGVTAGAEERTRDLTSILAAIARSAVNGPPAAAESNVARRLDAEATRELVSCVLAPDGASPARPAESRRSVFDLAKAYVAANSEEPLTVEDLCVATGANPRTLLRAFRACSGVSPKTYLRAHRLNGVRRLLRRSAPRTMSVGSAANRWGFWHMGQFAADYRRHFGEPPSATLCRERPEAGARPTR